jgi:hypothetical protein
MMQRHSPQIPLKIPVLNPLIAGNRAGRAVCSGLPPPPSTYFRTSTHVMGNYSRHMLRFRADVRRSQAGHSVIILVITVHSTQVILVDCCADSSAQTRSCILVGSKMNSAVNASVGDVVGNLPE